MTIRKGVAIAALVVSSLSATAHAELQTWRLTATSYQVQQGFSAPTFAQVGNSFTVDYLIDVQPAADSGMGWGNLIPGAVQAFTINGVTSLADGYALGGAGLHGLNTDPRGARGDGIDFLSLYDFTEADHASMTAVLNGLAASALKRQAYLRVDFGENSVWASPTSLVVLSVPEPTSAWLLLAGLPLALWGWSRERTAF